MEQDCVMLFNNVKNYNPDVFDCIKTDFFKCESYMVGMTKIFYAYKTDQEIRKTVYEVIDQGYDVSIYAVFDDQSLKDGSVAVYYTSLDEDFNEKKTFEESIRSNTDEVVDIHINLSIDNMG